MRLPPKMPCPPEKARAAPTIPWVGFVPVSFEGRVPTTSVTGPVMCQTLAKPLDSLNTAVGLDVLVAAGFPQETRSSCRECPRISGMRT